jgi:hypothetical protein
MKYIGVLLSVITLSHASAFAAAPCGFRVHKAGQTQMGGFQMNAYARDTNSKSLLTWAPTNSVGAFDYGLRFNNGIWTPVKTGEQPRMVSFSGQIWISWNGNHRDGGYNVPNFVAKIIKNGYAGCANGKCAQDVIAGIGVPGTFPSSMVIPFAGTDLAQPGDTYQVFLYTTNPDAWVDGNKAHTWFSGVCH